VPNGPKKSPIKNQPNPLRPFEDATTALKTAKSNAKKRISIAQTPHWSFVGSVGWRVSLRRQEVVSNEEGDPLARNP
jgi:hypothetical protein